MMNASHLDSFPRIHLQSAHSLHSSYLPTAGVCAVPPFLICETVKWMKVCFIILYQCLVDDHVFYLIRSRITFEDEENQRFPESSSSLQNSVNIPFPLS